MKRQIEETRNRRGNILKRGQRFFLVVASIRRFFGSLILCFALLLPACSSLTSDAPPVADSTMVDVLVEFHLAEARSQLRGDLSPQIRADIFASNGLDTVQFRAALDYYIAYPDDYLELYNSVLDRLAAEHSIVRDSLGSMSNEQ